MTAARQHAPLALWTHKPGAAECGLELRTHADLNIQASGTDGKGSIYLSQANAPLPTRWMTFMLWQCATTPTMVRMSAAA